MTHDCIFEREEDPFAVTQIFAERCRCHEDLWFRRRPDDPPHKCPVTGRTPSDQQGTR